MSWLLFPPQTKAAQLDEKWSFVGKKEARLTPGDILQGDLWDHTAIDPETSLLLALVPGKRTAENCLEIVEEVKRRTRGLTTILFTSDEHSPYKTAIEQAYAQEVPQPKRSGPGRPPKPKRVMPSDLGYATVRKTREKGRVVDVVQTAVFGSLTQIETLLAGLRRGNKINTSYVERHNGTDRLQNARKVRKTYCFSKDWDVHNAATYFIAYSYNFCWPVRTLRVKDAAGDWQDRSPAMAAGLADHVWSLREWLTFPARSG